MFKKILTLTALIAVSGVLILGAINRTQTKTGNSGENAGVGGYGRQSREVITIEQTNGTYAQLSGGNRFGQQADDDNNIEQANLQQLVPGELNAEETDALLYMREEEKLAHDVYVTLYDQ